MTQHKLVIAEKPSVAQAIAKVLGATRRRDGYLEGGEEDGYLVSWCVGHLVELAPADAYDPRYSRWAREDLPILPKEWKFNVSPGTRKQFDVLKSLMEREDVSELIEATDAGREGELIFRLVYEKAECRKPFKRLWISSMEDSAIREGLAHLTDGKEYDSLYRAALCRAQADWLVGINATRLFSTLYRGKTLNVGRVMTPTLALLTEREQEIQGFRKEKFHVVELDLGGFTAVSGRIKGKPEAERLRTSCLGRDAVVEEAVSQEREERPPRLYDLTSLQREANRAYGYTAQQTLDYVQALYEKKLCTYPRTDSRYLTEDMGGTLPSLCAAVAGAFPFITPPVTVDAAAVLDSAKVSDHHAIIPTKGIGGADLKALPTGERNLIFLIGTRLLCAACPKSRRCTDTSVTLRCGEGSFSVKGRTETEAGWKALERAFQGSLKGRPPKEEEVTLPPIQKGQPFPVRDAVLREGRTSPPSRYTEDTLLSAMEHAGAEEFAKLGDVERTGLGTPATRAGIIEKLIRGDFAVRKGRQLVPTEKGMELIRVLPDSVKSASLTARWEAELQQVELGKSAPEDFLSAIMGMVWKLVEEHGGAAAEGSAALTGKNPVGACPRCGKPVYEGKKSFYCSGYRDDPPCGFALWKENPYFRSKRKELTRDVAAALLKDGRVRMTGLFSERKGILYDAVIALNDTDGKYVGFKLEFEREGKTRGSAEAAGQKPAPGKEGNG